MKRKKMKTMFSHYSARTYQRDISFSEEKKINRHMFSVLHESQDIGFQQVSTTSQGIFVTIKVVRLLKKKKAMLQDPVGKRLQ